MFRRPFGPSVGLTLPYRTCGSFVRLLWLGVICPTGRQLKLQREQSALTALARAYPLRNYRRFPDKSISFGVEWHPGWPRESGCWL